MLKPIRLMLVVIAAAATLAACASRSPIVSPAEPHGVIVTQAEERADHTHPVHIVAIDGHPIPLEHAGPIYVAPGVHTVRLSPIVADNQVRDVRMDRRRDDPDAYVDIHVEPGIRYLVAARETGENMSEWRAVVTRTETIR